MLPGSPSPATDIGRSGHQEHALRFPILIGLLVGGVQAASPFAFSWIEQSTLHAIYISLIASVYVGFAVADGRPKALAIESVVATGFVLLAIAGVTETAWLLVVGYAGHGAKDYWQERHHFVANTRWWPTFCAAIDWLVAIILVIEIAVGVNFH